MNPSPHPSSPDDCTDIETCGETDVRQIQEKQRDAEKTKSGPNLTKTCKLIRQEIKKWRKAFKKHEPKVKSDCQQSKALTYIRDKLTELDNISRKYKDILQADFNFGAFPEDAAVNDTIKQMKDEEAHDLKNTPKCLVVTPNKSPDEGDEGHDVVNYQLEMKCKELQQAVQKLKIEKDEALTRLSKIAGERLHDNNPNIADLSTEVRPTKIAEKFRECYDNEWTEAYQELIGSGSTEERVINYLLKIVQKAYDFSHRHSLEYSNIVMNGINNFPPVSEKTSTGFKRQNITLTKDIQSAINDLRKVTATNVVHGLQTKFIGDFYATEHVTFRALGKQTQVFAEKCIEITWYMVIQTPPVVIEAVIQNGDRMNDDLFVFYKAKGEIIDFPVWPCVRLQAGGAVLSKGVVQGQKESTKSSDHAKTEVKKLRKNHVEDQIKQQTYDTMKTNKKEEKTLIHVNNSVAPGGKKTLLDWSPKVNDDQEKQKLMQEMEKATTNSSKLHSITINKNIRVSHAPFDERVFSAVPVSNE